MSTMSSLSSYSHFKGSQEFIFLFPWSVLGVTTEITWYDDDSIGVFQQWNHFRLFLTCLPMEHDVQQRPVWCIQNAKTVNETRNKATSPAMHTRNTECDNWPELEISSTLLLVPLKKSNTVLFIFPSIPVSSPKCGSPSFVNTKKDKL